MEHYSKVNKTTVGANGLPLCGAKHKDQYNVLSLSEKDWNERIATFPQFCCKKCIAAIENKKALSK